MGLRVLKVTATYPSHSICINAQKITCSVCDSVHQILARIISGWGDLGWQSAFLPWPAPGFWLLAYWMDIVFTVVEEPSRGMLGKSLLIRSGLPLSASSSWGFGICSSPGKWGPTRLWFSSETMSYLFLTQVLHRCIHTCFEPVESPALPHPRSVGFPGTALTLLFPTPTRRKKEHLAIHGSFHSINIYGSPPCTRPWTGQRA